MKILRAADDAGSNEFHLASGGGDTIDHVTADRIKLLDAVGIPILVLRRNFIVAGFNRAAADVLSLAPLDIGHSPRAISFLSGLQKLDRWCEEVISTNVPTQHDVRVADKSFIVRIAPYAEGQVSGTVLTFTNVTAFRASIDQAIYEREYAKAILNSVADPLLVLSADLHTLTANRAFYSLFRISREAIQGLPLNRLGNGALDLPRLGTQLKEMLTNDLPFQDLEIDREWPDGRRRTMSLYACTCALPGHSSGMALLSLHDITARKEAEAANSRLAAIVEFSDDAIVMKDLDGIITCWNAGAERIFGYSAEEAIGKPVMILIPLDHQSEEPKILERIRSGERIDHYETIRIRKDGRLIDISLTVSPVKNSLGTIIGASKIARDITNQKRAATQITVLAREAEHRTRNILTTVQAAVSLTKADTVADLKTAIEGRIQALANVNQLFVDSRWAGAELTNLVSQELAPYRRSEGGRRVRIEGASHLLEPSAAQALAVTVHELATNAAKYGALSTPEGKVEIAWELKSDCGLVFRWAESGGPRVTLPERQGFGTRVVATMIAQLHGHVQYDWHSSGLVCEITLPITP